MLVSGTWGCVFEGNCNQDNECLKEAVCDAESGYIVDEYGHCVVGDNGYPLQDEHCKSSVKNEDLEDLDSFKTSNAEGITLSLVASLFAGAALAL